jgi:hypothetical protein
MNGILVKMPRNIRSLWQVKFLVNLFVSNPHTNLFTGHGMNSGERSMILKLRKMKYNILPKFVLAEKTNYCVENIV